jgi:hypothetical protein
VELIGPTARLSLDDEGRVYAVEPETEESDGRITVVGHIDDDRRCPSARLGEWCALAAQWREQVADGRAEHALRAVEYHAAIGGRWSGGWLGSG